MLFVIDFGHVEKDWLKGLNDLEDSDRLILCSSKSATPPENIMEVMSALFQSRKPVELKQFENASENYTNFQIVAHAMDIAAKGQEAFIISENPDFKAVSDYHAFVICAKNIEEAKAEWKKENTAHQTTEISGKVSEDIPVKEPQPEHELNPTIEKIDTPNLLPEFMPTPEEKIPVKEQESNKDIWNRLVKIAATYPMPEPSKENMLEEINRKDASSISASANIFSDFRMCILPALGRKTANEVYDYTLNKYENDTKLSDTEDSFLTEEGETEEEFVPEDTTSLASFLEDTSAVWTKEAKDKVIRIAKEYDDLDSGKKEMMLNELEYADKLSFDMLDFYLNSMFAPNTAEKIYDYIAERYEKEL